jgi:hypothetical protein
LARLAWSLFQAEEFPPDFFNGTISAPLFPSIAAEIVAPIMPKAGRNGLASGQSIN